MADDGESLESWLSKFLFKLSFSPCLRTLEMLALVSAASRLQEPQFNSHDIARIVKYRR